MYDFSFLYSVSEKQKGRLFFKIGSSFAKITDNYITQFNIKFVLPTLFTWKLVNIVSAIK